MVEHDTNRLVAWNIELRAVHLRLRQALAVARTSLEDGTSGNDATRDLLLYCHGFCAALDGHHRGEDSILFPAIEAAHPELAPVLRMLEQDHSTIAHLVDGLQSAVEHARDRDELERHLDGIAAIMESHFRFEERRLLDVLEHLRLAATPAKVLGPI